MINALVDRELMKRVNLVLLIVGVFALTNFSSALYARGSTVTLCANKKTGSLRYINNGNCRSSENKIQLDQNGEVGQTGPQGPQGPTGPAGPAGADGANGANGANGSNASSVMLQDATGAKFVWVPNYIFWNGMMWPFVSSIQGSNSYINSMPYYYIDSACTQPIYPTSGMVRIDGPQVALITTSDRTVNGQILHGWRQTGTLQAIQRASSYYHWGGSSCVAESGTLLIDGDQVTNYYAAEAISWPMIVSPTTFVLGS